MPKSIPSPTNSGMKAIEMTLKVWKIARPSAAATARPATVVTRMATIIRAERDRQPQHQDDGRHRQDGDRQRPVGERAELVVLAMAGAVEWAACWCRVAHLAGGGDIRIVHWC